MAESLSSSQQILRFGTFEVNPQSGELRKGGVRIKLHGQPFEVLAMLLERPGQVVTREELRLRLWPTDTFVNFDQTPQIILALSKPCRAVAIACSWGWKCRIGQPHPKQSCQSG